MQLGQLPARSCQLALLHLHADWSVDNGRHQQVHLTGDQHRPPRHVAGCSSTLQHHLEEPGGLPASRHQGDFVASHEHMLCSKQHCTHAR